MKLAAKLDAFDQPFLKFASIITKNNYSHP